MRSRSLSRSSDSFRGSFTSTTSPSAWYSTTLFSVPDVFKSRTGHLVAGVKASTVLDISRRPVPSTCVGQYTKREQKQHLHLSQFQISHDLRAPSPCSPRARVHSLVPHTPLQSRAHYFGTAHPPSGPGSMLR
eukprot:935827-Rhodomonas_salina.3